MSTSDTFDYIQIAKNNILQPGVEFTQQSTKNAFDRLFSRQDALLAWGKLWAKDFVPPAYYEFDSDGNPDRESSWFFMTREIGSCFPLIAIPESQKITGAQIRKAAENAAKKARALARLIDTHFSLETITLMGCLSTTEVSAYEEASKIYQKEYHAGRTESPLDGNYHYRTIEYQFMQQDMRDILWRFADQAEKTALQIPLSERPTGYEVGAKLFCVGICQNFEYCYGKPMIEIAAAFASAIFDRDIGNDTVKSWWQRRNDRSYE